MKSLLRSPLVSAAVGGLAVAGVLLALGVTGHRTTTTVIDEAPLTAAPASDVGAGLTPYEIYQRDAPSVVFVRADVDESVEDPFALPDELPGVSTGSGFLVDKHGDILTDYHVVAGANTGEISVEFEHGVTKAAQIIGEDPNDDLAILRVNVRGLGLAPLALGNSATARVGDPTLAIANPFGVDRTLTTGIVSALQRQITAADGFSIDNVIQTDAPADQGVSGGPLIDAAGRVIGISSQIMTGEGGQGSVPVGFAVPSNTAKSLLPRLEGVAAPTRAYLGVAGVTVNHSLVSLGVAARRGVLVESVDPSGPAARVGVRAGSLRRVVDGRRLYLGGDVIERIDGDVADTAGALNKVVASKRPGEVVALTILRGRRLETVDVMLGSEPPPG